MEGTLEGPALQEAVNQGQNKLFFHIPNCQSQKKKCQQGENSHTMFPGN